MTAAPPTRADAARLDAADPLAGLRAELVTPREPLVYLDGNSLGMPARAALAALERTTRDEWAERLVRAWNEGWFVRPGAVGDRLGAVLLDAAPGQVLVCDSTTVNLYKLAVAAIDAAPSRSVIVCEADGFPTDRYVLQGIAAARGLTLRTAALDDLAAVVDADTALVCASHVDFRTAAIADMVAINAAAHAAGARTLWDVSHSVGAVPVELDASGTDLAVGCTYKYVGAGPGAPAFLYVRADQHEHLRQPIWGWFGRADVFAMPPGYEPASGITRFLTGTPPVLGLALVDACVDVLARAGVAALRAKSAALTALAVTLHDAWLAPLGCALATPRDPARRGAHVAVRHPDAYRLCRALIEHHRVIPDFRPPDVVRLGFAPASTRFVDVWDGVAALRAVLDRGEHLEVSNARGTVT